jgi:hypothetical protein
VGFANWESFLEKHIEGFFTKKFSSELEPAEAVHQLEREIVRRRKKTRRGDLVPNGYGLQMSGQDYQRLCARRFLDALYLAAEKLVIRENCFMDGRLHITVEKDAKLSEGMCEVISRYEEEPAPQADKAEPHTIVLDRSEFQPPLNLPAQHKTASLTVIEGPDLDSYLEIGERQVYLGRRESNEFILTDTNASRLHAYISYERHRHVLHDAESLNGTWVRDKKIADYCLCSGDEFRIGSTVLLYEVI